MTKYYFLIRYKWYFLYNTTKITTTLTTVITLNFVLNFYLYNFLQKLNCYKLCAVAVSLPGTCQQFCYVSGRHYLTRHKVQSAVETSQHVGSASLCLRLECSWAGEGREGPMRRAHLSTSLWLSSWRIDVGWSDVLFPLSFRDGILITVARSVSSIMVG